jgi:hypothetical protein
MSRFNGKTSIGLRRAAPRAGAAIFMIAMSMAAPVMANPTQEEVFQSINQSVGSTVDLSKLVPYLTAGLAAVILLVWFTHRRQYRVVPRALNHAGKLMKEVGKKIELRSGESKVLKVLAEEQNVTDPLLLLLCPSVLGKAIRNQESRVDRDQLAELVKRLRGDGGASHAAARKDIMGGHGGEDH